MEGKDRRKKEAFYVVNQGPGKCNFYRIPGYIVAMSDINGSICCAFFDEELHTEESIKKNNQTIKLHSIYSSQ